MRDGDGRTIALLWVLNFASAVLLYLFLPNSAGVDVFYHDTYFVLAKLHVVLLFLLVSSLILSVVTFRSLR